MVCLVTALPTEILCVVLKLLDVNDIISLRQCLRIPIPRDVYNHVFYEHRTSEQYDSNTFDERTRAKLYLFGELCSPSCDDYEHIRIGEVTYRRMTSPWRVPFEGVVCQGALGRESLHILDGHGDLCIMEMFRESATHFEDTIPVSMRSRPPYVLRKVQARTCIEDDFDKDRSETERRKEEERYRLGVRIVFLQPPGPLQPPSRHLVEFSDRLFSEPRTRTRLVDIVPGDRPCVRDDRGLLWKWHDYNGGIIRSLQGTPMCGVKACTGELIDLWKMVKSATIQPTTIALIRDLGMISFGGIVLRYQNTTSSNGYRAGFPCFDDHCCFFEAARIAGTDESVRDFVIFYNQIVCLGADGHLTVVPVPLYDKKYHTEIMRANLYGRFTQLAATKTQLALVTTDKRVVLLTLVETFPGRAEMNIHELKTLQGLTISSIVCGTSHFLALTSTGDVYSWGRDQLGFESGCLGLGKLENALKMDGVRLVQEQNRGFTLVADVPIKLNLPGKVYAIAAENTQSAVLI